MTPHVAVIGGGIAGASVAFALARAQLCVTVIDAGGHTASHVPSALVNPVRGQSGGVDARAPEGMALTWALVRDMVAQGYAVPHGQSGVVRPLPDDRTRTRFERNLPGQLPHRWLAHGKRPDALTDGWAHALLLPGGGWLDGQALCRALLGASGAAVVHDRATAWEARAVSLHSGGTLKADAVVWCGGSVGSTWAGEDATHRMGTLLTLNRSASEVPLSFGAYLAPAAQGGVLGATFEAPTTQWKSPRLPLPSLGWLLGKGAALSNLEHLTVTGQWTGSRLSGLQAGTDANGMWRLSGLGSKGFLLGPLLAFELVARLQRALQSRVG